MSNPFSFRAPPLLWGGKATFADKIVFAVVLTAGAFWFDWYLLLGTGLLLTSALSLGRRNAEYASMMILVVAVGFLLVFVGLAQASGLKDKESIGELIPSTVRVLLKFGYAAYVLFVVINSISFVELFDSARAADGFARSTIVAVLASWGLFFCGFGAMVQNTRDALRVRGIRFGWRFWSWFTVIHHLLSSFGLNVFQRIMTLSKMKESRLVFPKSYRAQVPHRAQLFHRIFLWLATSVYLVFLAMYVLGALRGG